MNKRQFIILTGVCTMLSIGLFGCTAPKEPSESSAESTSAASVANTISETDVSLDVTADVPKQEDSNMVDERFELLSLVFRLAGRKEYSDAETEYQKKLDSEFGLYKEHDAVTYASKLPLGYDAVFNFSVHIQKNDEQFVFIDDIGSLVDDGRWTQQSATDFLELLNDFYAETSFGVFYQSNIDFYEAETQLFIDNMYSEIDLEWFETYVESDNLRCVYSPSSSRCNYGATVNDTIVYCAVSGEGSVVVHEYCHSFANTIAHKWYEENPEFQKWCDDTIDPVKLPSYNNGKTIAGEYVTRAYNTLYYVEHGYAPAPLLSNEKVQGFPYIEEVYGMIAPYEKTEMGDDKIENILGVSYEMGEEQSLAVGDREIRWQVLSLSEPLPSIFQQTEVGNVFGSNTDDVLYVVDTGENIPYLLIDLGETMFQGKAGFRKYCRIPIE